MPHLKIVAGIVLTALLSSCASKSAAVVSVVSPVSVPVTVPVPVPVSVQPVEEEDLFDRALREIKMNTKSIKKHFEPREVIVSFSGYRTVEAIAVKGEFQIDNHDFEVIYKFGDAVRVEANLFRVSFSAVELSSGVSCDDDLLWSPSDEEVGLLLSFDDDYFDTWRRYFDVFDAYGAKVTFFVQGRPERPAAGYSPADFCVEALSRGHALGFHTVNHSDLTKASPDKFRAETTEAAAAFLGKGIQFSAFAYPFGFSDPWMREALTPFFFITRGYGTSIRFFDTEIDNNGFLVSTAIDNIVYSDKARFENDILKILLAAKFAGHCAVPFTTHDIADGAQWGIEPERLEYLLDTARELRLRFYTYADIR
jgi:peptidoglycan/xylan/chitin deacetylase (PgdA/CDA1 family)